MNFAALTQLALLGTGRQGLTLPADGTTLADLQAQLSASPPEAALLAAAALASQYERAGALPSRDATSLPPPCPREAFVRAGTRAGSLLRRFLDGEQASLLPEWLALATAARQLAPPELLPALLGTGTRSAALQRAILPVLGERGPWLALQNPEWAWVGGAVLDESVWQTGDPAARRLYLHQLRATQPRRARELLLTTWKEESPDDRAAFIQSLDLGLSLEDEGLLETALDDKRKEVRRAAAAFLVRLPGSALAQRMTGRALPLLKFVPAESARLLKLKKSKPALVEIALPDVCDRPMQRDGLEPKPPAGWGEKTWWLIQLLAATPLGTWTREWQVTEADILTASLAGEADKELFEGWCRAAIGQRHPAWADLLFPETIRRKRHDLFEGLLAALPETARETHLADLLTADDAQTREYHGPLVAQCRHEWSETFSRAVLAWLRRLTLQTGYDWQLRNQFPDFASRLAPAVLPEAATGWRTDVAGAEFWTKGADEWLTVVQLRQELQETLRPAPAA